MAESVDNKIIEDNLIKCTTFNDLYNFINNLYKDIDFIAVNKEWITFIINNQFINYKIDVNFIDLPYPFYINMYIPLEYLSLSNIKKNLLNKNYQIYSTNYKISIETFTIFINNNKKLLDLNKYKKNLFLYNESIDYLLLLPKSINIENITNKINLIYDNKYNLEKFSRALFEFKNNTNVLNNIINNYNNVDILNNIIKNN